MLISPERECANLTKDFKYATKILGKFALERRRKKQESNMKRGRPWRLPRACRRHAPQPFSMQA
jgi:hypothetical protein